MVGIGMGVFVLQGLLTVLMYQSREQTMSLLDQNKEDRFNKKPSLRKEDIPKGPTLPEKIILSAEERQRLVNMEQSVQAKINEGGASRSVQSCRLHPELDCTAHGDSSKIYVYNPWNQERIVVCRDEQPKQNQQDFLQIPSQGVISLPLSSSCNMISTRLFPTVPSLENAKDLPPTVLLTSPQMQRTRGLQVFRDCDIPCHFDNPISINTERFVQGTPWSFMCSMEGPHYYHNLRYDKQAHLQNHFYATTSYASEVPLPYYSWAEYNIQKNPAVAYGVGIKGASFLARNCGSRNDREGLVQEIIKLGFRVDSLSSCLRNAELPPGVDSLHDKKLVQAQYLFHLAFENQNEPDYITEKLWGTLESGTLPIYYGAPNVKEHAPPNSVISVQDFNTTEALVKYLNQVMNNQTLYESYHAWRTKPLPESFHNKYDFTRVHSTCRMCRWAFAKRYGLRWNASTQSLSSNIGFGRHSSSCRRRRTDSNSRSFEETWWKNPAQPGLILQAGTIVASSEYDCNRDSSGQSQSPPSLQTAKAGGIQRTIWTYDGVLDMLIEMDTSGVGHRNDQPLGVQWLRFTSTTGRSKLVRDDQDSRRARFQDDLVRWTILTSSNVAMTSSSSGIIDIPISVDHLPLRIRFIEEELDLFHEGGKEELYYFGEMMANDFFNPIELFHVD